MIYFVLVKSEKKFLTFRFSPSTSKKKCPKFILLFSKYEYFPSSFGHFREREY